MRYCVVMVFLMLFISIPSWSAPFPIAQMVPGLSASAMYVDGSVKAGTSLRIPVGTAKLEKFSMPILLQVVNVEDEIGIGVGTTFGGMFDLLPIPKDPRRSSILNQLSVCYVAAVYGDKEKMKNGVVFIWEPFGITF
jgi:hypothetical protein